MVESIYLVGAEQVQSAAATISCAADRIETAANYIIEAVNHADRLVCRLEELSAR